MVPIILVVLFKIAYVQLSTVSIFALPILIPVLMRHSIMTVAKGFMVCIRDDVKGVDVVYLFYVCSCFRRRCEASM